MSYLPHFLIVFSAHLSLCLCPSLFLFLFLFLVQRVICSTSVYPVGQLKVCEVDALASALYAPSSCAFHATLAHFIYLPQPVARLDLDLALDLCPLPATAAAAFCLNTLMLPRASLDRGTFKVPLWLVRAHAMLL